MKKSKHIKKKYIMEKKKYILLGGLVLLSGGGIAAGVMLPKLLNKKDGDVNKTPTDKNDDDQTSKEEVRTLFDQIVHASSEQVAMEKAKEFYGILPNQKDQLTKSAEFFGKYVYANKDTRDYKLAWKKDDKNKPDQAIILVFKKDGGTSKTQSAESAYADSIAWFTNDMVGAEFAFLQSYLNKKVAFSEFVAGTVSTDPSTKINGVASKDWAIYNIFQNAFAKNDWSLIDKSYKAISLKDSKKTPESIRKQVANIIFKVSEYNKSDATLKYDGLSSEDLIPYISEEVKVDAKTLVVKSTFSKFSWSKDLTGINGQTSLDIAQKLKAISDNLMVKDNPTPVIPTDLLSISNNDFINLAKNPSLELIEALSSSSIATVTLTNGVVGRTNMSVSYTYTIIPQDGSKIPQNLATGTLVLEGFISQADLVAAEITAEEIIAKLTVSGEAELFTWVPSVDIVKDVNGVDVTFKVNLTEGDRDQTNGTIQFSWIVEKNDEMTKATSKQEGIITGFDKVKPTQDIIDEIQALISSNMIIAVAGKDDVVPKDETDEQFFKDQIKAVLKNALPLNATITLSNRENGDGQIIYDVIITYKNVQTNVATIVFTGFKDNLTIATEELTREVNAFETAVTGFANHEATVDLSNTPSFPKTPFDNLDTLLTHINKTYTNSNNNITIEVVQESENKETGQAVYNIKFSHNKNQNVQPIQSKITINNYKTSLMEALESEVTRLSSADEAEIKKIIKKKAAANLDNGTKPKNADFDLTTTIGKFTYSIKSVDIIDDNGEVEVTLNITITNNTGTKTETVKVTVTGFETKAEKNKKEREAAINAVDLASQISTKANSQSKTAVEISANDFTVTNPSEIVITITKVAISKTTTDGTSVSIEATIASADNSITTLTRTETIEIDGLASLVTAAKAKLKGVVQNLDAAAIKTIDAFSDKSKTPDQVATSSSSDIITAVKALITIDAQLPQALKDKMEELKTSLVIEIGPKEDNNDNTSFNILVKGSTIDGNDKSVEVAGLKSNKTFYNEEAQKIAATVTKLDITAKTNKLYTVIRNINKNGFNLKIKVLDLYVIAVNGQSSLTAKEKAGIKALFSNAFINLQVKTNKITTLLVEIKLSIIGGTDITMEIPGFMELSDGAMRNIANQLTNRNIEEMNDKSFIDPRWGRGWREDSADDVIRYKSELIGLIARAIAKVSSNFTWYEYQAKIEKIIQFSSERGGDELVIRFTMYRKPFIWGVTMNINP